MFLPEKSLAGYSPWDCKDSGRTKQQQMSFSWMSGEAQRRCGNELTAKAVAPVVLLLREEVHSLECGHERQSPASIPHSSPWLVSNYLLTRAPSPTPLFFGSPSVELFTVSLWLPDLKISVLPKSTWIDLTTWKYGTGKKNSALAFQDLFSLQIWTDHSVTKMKVLKTKTALFMHYISPWFENK